MNRRRPSRSSSYRCRRHKTGTAESTAPRRRPSGRVIGKRRGPSTKSWWRSVATPIPSDLSWWKQRHIWLRISEPMQLIGNLLRPYRGWLAVILLALLVETAMSLAGPWPLKIVLDSVVGRHPLPGWIVLLLGPRIPDDRVAIAAAAAAGLVIIGVFGSIASYIDHYYTENVGQRVANDLRMRVFHHLDRLSLAYYDTQQTGGLLSTITTDISTIQSFASEATLGILIDLLTIIGMLGLMFWLNFDFALIAVAVMPFILVFVMRFKRAVKRATREVRHRQSDVVAVVQEGLQSIRVVQAYGRQDLAEAHLQEAGK